MVVVKMLVNLMLECVPRMRLWSSKIANRADSRLAPANERRRYKVTPSLVGWTQTYTQPLLRYILFLSQKNISL